MNRRTLFQTFLVAPLSGALAMEIPPNERILNDFVPFNPRKRIPYTIDPNDPPPFEDFMAKESKRIQKIMDQRMLESLGYWCVIMDSKIAEDLGISQSTEL